MKLVAINGSPRKSWNTACGSIIQYPYLENKSDRPRAVIGMFDVSASPMFLRRY
jgi:hypothetical protein